VSAMFARLAGVFRARNLVIAVLVFALVIGARTLAEHVRALVVWGDVLEEVAAIDEVPESGAPLRTSWSFDYLDTTCTVTASVDPGQLAQARAIDTSRVFGTRLWLRAGYVSDLVRVQSDSRFIGKLAEQFAAIRRDLRLDDDEYLELMARAVQAVPYGEIADEILLPIEVIAEGRGVCSEKSILLAALMLHEGYDTCVWVFETQGHAAVGVRSDGARYWNSDYAFIETTRYAFVGQASAEYLARGPIAKPPEMIRVGGSTPYTAGHEVAYIVSKLGDAGMVSAVSRDYPRHARNAHNYHQPRFARRADEYYGASDLSRYIMANTHDRARVYRELIGYTVWLPPGGS